MSTTERRADSTVQEFGGHHLHVEGGAETMWRQVGHLTMAVRELSAEIDRMRAYCCPKCGEPAAITLHPDDPSPFLKTLIATGDSHV